MASLRRSRVAGLLLALWLVAAVHASRAAEAHFAGRPVAEVLQELRAAGLQLLYSSQLVSATLRVLSEPAASDPVGIAREILAPHGLALSSVAPGVYAVVSADPSPQTPPAPPAPRPAVPRSPDEPPPLAEIVVATSRYATGEQQMGAFELEGVDLAAQPGVGDDSLRSLARLPGIAQGGVSARSNVRGGEASEVLVLLDGFNVRQAFHLPAYQSLFSVVDPSIIADAEVFTGGFPARYGNRMSGVFDLRTVDPSRTPRRSLGLSFFNAFGRAGGSIEPLGADYLVSARVGVLKPLLHAFEPDAGSPSYSDVYARAERGSTDRLRVSGNFLWARDELSIDDERSGESAQIESRSRYAWLRAEHEWSDALVGALWIGNSRIDSVRNGTVDDPLVAAGRVDDSRTSEFWDAKGQVEWRANERHWLESGFEWTDERGQYRYASAVRYTPIIAGLFGRDPAQARDFRLEPSRDRIALFGTHRWRATDELTTEIGLRVQRVLTRGAETDWIQDPRISLRWQVTPRTSLRAHWGRFHQADEIQELRVEDGLPGFPPSQRVEHLIFGVEHRFAGGLGMRIEAFRKDQPSPRPRFENFLSTLSILPELAPDRILIAPDFAEVRGAELSFGLEGRGWRRWAALAWSQAVDEIDGAGEIPRSWDQTWAATVGLEWTRGPWRFGAIANAHRGWPTTRVLQGPMGEASLGVRNGARLPTYASLDLRGEYRRPLALGNLVLAAEVTNATNHRNLCCTGIDVARDEQGAVGIATRERAWLPLLPSLSVRWDF